MMQMKQTVLALAATGMLAGPALAAEGLGAEAPGMQALQPVQAVAVAEQVAEQMAELPAPPALAEVATQAAADTLPAELLELPAVLALTPPEPFSAADMQALFVPGHEPLRVAVLSPQEMEETKGAVWNFVFGGAMGFGAHAIQHRRNMTWRSAAIATGTGALTGGVGGALIRASGGGIAGQVAWRPNMLATNFGVGQVNNPSRRR